MTDHLPAGRSGGGYADPAEEALRAHLSALAAQAPPPADFASTARAEVGRQRRRTGLAALVGVVVVGLVLGVAVWGRSGTSTAPVADRRLKDVPTGVLTLNGVQVTVPASMLVDGGCLPPDAAYIARPGAALARCPHTEEDESASNWVVLSPFPRGTPAPDAGVNRAVDGRITRVRYVDERGVRIAVTSPSRRFIREVLASVRVLPLPDWSATPPPSTEPGSIAGMERWLAEQGPWRDELTELAGGRVYCEIKVLGRSAPRDHGGDDQSDVYAWATCEQLYDDFGKVAEGSGISAAIVLHISGADPFSRVTGATAPRQQNLVGDIRDLFPPELQDTVIGGGNFAGRPTGQVLLERARADLAAGKLPPLTPGVGVRPSTVLGPFIVGLVLGHDGPVTSEVIPTGGFVPLHRCDAPVGADAAIARRFVTSTGKILGAQRVLRLASDEAATNTMAQLIHAVDACDEPTDAEPPVMVARETVPLPGHIDGTAWRYTLDTPGRGREIGYVAVLHVGSYVTELVITGPATQRPGLEPLNELVTRAAENLAEAT